MRIREPFNALSHLVGMVLMLAGAIYLVLEHRDDARAWISFSVYGVMASLLFAASAVYHWTQQVHRTLQRLDHLAIYLMIAGTATPVALLGFNGLTSWGILAAQWVLATIGAVTTFALEKPPTWLRLTLYLVMGWMILPFLSLLWRENHPAVAIWMMVGGLFYTVGAVIYAAKKPELWPGKFGSHELWHVLVLGGAASHFAVMLYL